MILDDALVWFLVIFAVSALTAALLAFVGGLAGLRRK